MMLVTNGNQQPTLKRFSCAADRRQKSTVDYVAEILVGPLWLRLIDVSPTVTIAGYESQEADEADLMWIRVKSCRWEFPEAPDPKRIRLVVSLDIGGGEQASITSLAYHLVARGLLAPGQNFNEDS